MSASHGWALVTQQRKAEILEAIRTGGATAGPAHVELDLTDRCNVACYFCNQMDVRTRESLPLERLGELLDDMVVGGLRSVRLSGGGDPLMYKGFAGVQDLLQERGVVIDNLTTNGALMTPEIAEKLVRDQAREVVFSLNAVDADDYQRMMKVRPRTFDQVVGNIRQLAELRNGSRLPTVVVQFLLDPANFRRLPDMYQLGCSLGADHIAVNVVLEIPNDRLQDRHLLGPNDFELARPYLEQVLRADRDAGRLQLCFPWPQWNELVERLRQAIEAPEAARFPTADTFHEDYGQCFFAWYSATVRGTGEMYPCCMLMSPDYQPLGNALEGGVRQQWQGPTFGRLRQQMREVILTKGRLFRSAERLDLLRPQCIEEHRCSLKNMYFRGDRQFYGELRGAVDELRAREAGWIGSPKSMARAAEVFAFRAYHGTLVRARAAGKTLKRKLRKMKPDLEQSPKLHVGCGNKRLDGWVNIDNQDLPGVDLVADVTGGLKFSNCEAVYAEHFLEHLAVSDAVSFLTECHRVLAEGGVLRLSTPNLDWVWKTHYYLEADDDTKVTMAVGLNRAFHGWEHQFLWNRQMLQRVLDACGFIELEWLPYGHSRRKVFNNIERHETYQDTPELPHVLIVEAVRGPAQPEKLAELRAMLQGDYLNHMRG